MKERYHDYKRVVVIPPAQVTATTLSSAFDTLGYDSVLILVITGALAAADAANLLTASLTECATLAGSYTAVPAADHLVESDDWDRLINALAEANGCKAFAWRRSTANSRFLKVNLEETGTFDGIVGVIALLGDGDKPVY